MPLLPKLYFLSSFDFDLSHPTYLQYIHNILPIRHLPSDFLLIFSSHPESNILLEDVLEIQNMLAKASNK